MVPNRRPTSATVRGRVVDFLGSAWFDSPAWFRPLVLLELAWMVIASRMPRAAFFQPGPLASGAALAISDPRVIGLLQRNKPAGRDDRFREMWPPAPKPSSSIEPSSRRLRDAGPAPLVPDLVRVASDGTEGLLASAVTDQPSEFEAIGDGRLLRAERQLDADGLAPYLGATELTMLGTDESGAAYFAPDEPETKVRLVPAGNGGVVFEPHGIRLYPTETTDAATSRDGKSAVPAGPAPLPSTARGPVEVRLLRELPDLVGAVTDSYPAAAVEFVAFLALHGRRASTSRLRDALGSARTNGSQSQKTVWSAASAARRAIGEAHLPTTGGSSPYLLGEAVTCDWLRFRQLADAAQTESDDERRTDTLVAAFELVDGVPAAGSTRFGWLDREGFVREICDAVDVARTLAELARAREDDRLAAWVSERVRAFDGAIATP